jgi:hypothetical protein
LKTTPEHRVFVVYGEIEPQFVIARCPYKGNWHKTYAPALKRLVRTLGLKPKGFWNVDSMGASWNTTKCPRYDFINGEFVKV